MPDGSPARDAWTAAMELLREAGELSDSQTAFVRMALPLAAVDDVFMIGVGSEFVKNWIEQHVGDAMTAQLSAILGRNVKLMISVDPSLSEQQAAAPVQTPAPSWTPSPQQESFHDRSQEGHFRDDQYGEDRNLQAVPTQYADSSSTPLADSYSDPFEKVDDQRRHDQSFDDFGQFGHSRDEQMRSQEEYRQDRFLEGPDYSGNHPRHDQARQGGLTPPRPPNTNKGQAEARLNPRYTFETFVIGESNRFAHATALAVSEAPGSTYNPLFLYSDSGMGKTHLLHAIGNYTMRLYPDRKVLYVSAEEFTNAFINALRDQKQHTFKDQFRTVDVLLIDDIQFLSGMDRTIEEFFHTFNALANANKQIVITSDVAPKLLTGFEDRMISRFASGITANIDLPNLETRIAILDKKAASESMNVPRPVVEFIASKMTTNVREMEGALRRVTAFADLSDQQVSLDVAELVLKDMISDPSSIQITAGLIMAQTASYFGISMADLKAPTRTRTLTQPRHIAMYLCREMTDLSLPKIAELFDRRDHTTVINALRKIDKLMTEKQSIYNQVSDLTGRIKQAAKDQSKLSET